MPGPMAAAAQRKAAKDPKGLYSKLGVEPNADNAEIRKAYRRLALIWHPDKNQDNPEATAEFQKISAAYEVLSDDDKRYHYDRTGCIDEEELDGYSQDHFKDLFAAFFGGGFGEDLDLDEQGMLDELLRGGRFLFRQKPRKHGKGRAGHSAGAGIGFRGMEEVLESLFGGQGNPKVTVKCPKGHGFKRRKADGDYECDACGRDIPTGKRVFDCRKCDYSLCQRCHKAKKDELEREKEGLDESEEDGCDLERVIEEVVEKFVTPCRQGGKQKFRCEFCQKTRSSKEEVMEHISMEHEEELEEAVEERMKAGG